MYLQVTDDNISASLPCYIRTVALLLNIKITAQFLFELRVVTF